MSCVSGMVQVNFGANNNSVCNVSHPQVSCYLLSFHSIKPISLHYIKRTVEHKKCNKIIMRIRDSTSLYHQIKKMCIQLPL